MITEAENSPNSTLQNIKEREETNKKKKQQHMVSFDSRKSKFGLKFGMCPMLRADTA